MMTANWGCGVNLQVLVLMNGVFVKITLLFMTLWKSRMPDCWIMQKTKWNHGKSSITPWKHIRMTHTCKSTLNTHTHRYVHTHVSQWLNSLWNFLQIIFLFFSFCVSYFKSPLDVAEFIFPQLKVSPRCRKTRHQSALLWWRADHTQCPWQPQLLSQSLLYRCSDWVRWRRVLFGAAHPSCVYNKHNLLDA